MDFLKEILATINYAVRDPHYIHQEGSDAANILTITLYATILLTVVVYPLLIWFFSIASPEKKERIFRKVFLLSPVWLSFSLFFLLLRIPEILGGSPVYFIDFFTVAAFVIMATVYLFFGLCSASLAHAVIVTIRSSFRKAETKVSNFWQLLDKIRLNRLAVLLILLFFLLFSILLNIKYFLEIKEANLLDGQFAKALIVVFPILILFYLLSEIIGYGKVNIPVVGHKKKKDLEKAIENISITAGIETPEFKILKSKNPNAFSICPNFKKPTIFVTNSLLSLVNKNELEAVIGHEIAFISSKRVFDYKRINNLLALLKSLTALSWLLFIFIIEIMLPVFWLLVMSWVIIVTSVKGTLDTWELGGDEEFSGGVILLIPPLTLINFISYLIYYALSFNENFYADLKTIQFTRYPQGFYSVLQKIENYSGSWENLPREFHHLYFIGEGLPERSIPMSQPTIQERKEILKEIDYTLEHLKFTKTKTDLKCPCCGYLMKEVKGKRHYNFPLLLDYCPKCGGIWFDDMELFYVADLFAETKDLKKKSVKKLAKLLCPHCGIEIELLIDPNIPKDVEIWNCSGCGGNWLRQESFKKYTAYRKKKLSKKK